MKHYTKEINEQASKLGLKFDINKNTKYIINIIKK